MTEEDAGRNTGRKLAVIVGAGVAGCQAARALLRAGYDALILEQGRALGGVWRRNYHSFALQVPWRCYTFPEFPYEMAPSVLAERAKHEYYPSGNTVKDYITAYCSHFQLEQHILFGAKVVHLCALPDGRWSVRFRQAASPAQSPDLGALKTMEAHVVVMATGMYYNPYVPAVPGLGSFKGKVMHARDFTSVDWLRGKRVLVLGAGKSAHDCAVVAASTEAGASCVTTVYRQAHWPLPRMLFGIPFHKVVYTRFTAAMLPMYYTGQGRPTKRLKHALLTPLKRLFWGTLEVHVARKMRLRGPLRPEAGFVEDAFFGGQIQDGAWNEAVNAGRINAVQGCLAEIMPGGVRLGDGTMIECDVIVFATGYTKDYSLFDAATAARLMQACPGTRGLHLYRSVVPPWVSNLYFIGSEASSFNNVLTSGLQSLWMMHHLQGRIQLQSPAELMKDILEQRTWRQGVMPSQYYSPSSIMLFQQHYHDQLVADMGHNIRRKRVRRRGGSEYFGVYTSHDYADIFEDAATPGLAQVGAAAATPRTAQEVLAAAVTLMPAAAAISARLDLAVLPGGGGHGTAAAPSHRPTALMPVCTSNSSNIALAFAPDVSSGTNGKSCSANGEAAAPDGGLGAASAFVGSLESPRVHLRALRPAPAPAPAPAAASSRHAAVPPASLAILPEDFPGSGGRLTQAEGGVAAGLDTTTTITSDGRRSLGLAVDGARVSPACHTPGASCADGNVQSIFSTAVAMTAARQAGHGVSPPPTSRMPLAQRVRLQVLHLVSRSSGGTLLQPNPAGEEILELGLPSHGGIGNRLPESLGASSQVVPPVSSSLCVEAARQAAPNVYSELMGTLEAH